MFGRADPVGDADFLTNEKVKPRQNDRNILQRCWAQHVACVWPSCCDMLRPVGSNLTIFKLEPTTPNMSQHGGQTHATVLRPTMLRYVAIVMEKRKANTLDMYLIVFSTSRHCLYFRCNSFQLGPSSRIATFRG